MASHSHYKKYSAVGPGGKKCSCCYPAPGKARRLAERLDTHREHAAAMKDARKEVDAYLTHA